MSAQGSVSQVFSLPEPPVTPVAYAMTIERLMDGDSAAKKHLAVNGHMVMRQDSARRLADSLVRHWVAGLRTQPIERLQQVPMLTLEARAGDIAAVQHRVTTLLAVPSRPDEERIWILSSVIRGLMVAGGTTVGDTVPSAAAFQVARTYEGALARMSSGASGDLAMAARVGAFLMFMERAWADHDVAQAMRDGWQAYAVLAAIPSYEVRAMTAGSPGTIDASLRFCIFLSGQPHGRAAVDSLMRLLDRAATAPPTVVAQDTMYRMLEQTVKQDLGKLADVANLLGTKAPLMVATHWFNQPAPTAAAPAELVGTTGTAVHMKPMNDGRIHIIQYGFYGCPHGPPAARALQRMIPTLPRDVDVQYYTETEGHWGGELADPDVEAEHLRKYWLEYRKITFPITVWAGKKVRTPDGGMLPEGSPVVKAYHFASCPTFVVVDGQGVVRFWKDGSEAVKELRGVITLLNGERTQGTAASSASVLPSMTSMSTSTNVGVSHP